MREVLLVAAAACGLSLLASSSASAVSIGGAVALIDAAKSRSAVINVGERCRVKCWRYSGERICRKRCYQS